MDKDVRMYITDWLVDSQHEVWKKSASQDTDIVEAIFHLIEEWKSNKELLSTLCLRLYGYYRADVVDSKVFALQFVPSLIYSYLSAIAHGEKKDVGSMQTLLLALYNLEAGSEAQNPKTQSFRIPNIAQPSIFHDTSALAASSLTESALKRLDPTNRITAKFGPHPHLQSFNAENRLPALSVLLRIYSNYLCMYNPNSLTETCIAFRRLVSKGFTQHSHGEPRIGLSSKLLVEILQIVYSLTMEDGDLGNIARQTLEAVQRRVDFELMSAPLMVCAAMADNSHLSIKGMHSSPHLVSSGAPGTTAARAMWKSMITNASFRTKKLPDDITVAQVAEAAMAAATTGSPGAISTQNSASAAAQLSSITEENDDAFGAGIAKSSFRLSELVKKKSKAKEKPSRSKINNNGVPTQDGAHENGSVVVNQADWQSDGETYEDIELRGRNEFNGSTQV
uniref:EOG090X02H3 n=1 Tax=Moina brachiata TaxID=675436 RepID=A0A4Y7NJ15_9CRUS|nr:EOG090X02H3 [Moina brachiata]SVE92893.1 EOG090X02H3 [Moina brachiata]